MILILPDFLKESKWGCTGQEGTYEAGSRCNGNAALSCQKQQEPHLSIGFLLVSDI